jgi:hypothetical protein
VGFKSELLNNVCWFFLHKLIWTHVELELFIIWIEDGGENQDGVHNIQNFTHWSPNSKWQQFFLVFTSIEQPFNFFFCIAIFCSYFSHQNMNKIFSYEIFLSKKNKTDPQFWSNFWHFSFLKKKNLWKQPRCEC